MKEGIAQREQAILRIRFGLDDSIDRSLQDLGEAFRVTRERIRQIEAKALAKLRHSALARTLLHFSRRGVFAEAFASSPIVQIVTGTRSSLFDKPWVGTLDQDQRHHAAQAVLFTRE